MLADLTLCAGSSVTLTDEQSVGLGAEMTVAIDPSLVQSSTWTYGYEAPEYYLTSADGPWGSLVFDYDEIGNRVSEDRDGLLETYTYELNTSGGNSPILASVLPHGGGSRDFTYGSAGHLELFEASGNEIDFMVDDDGRLGEIIRLPGQPDEESAEFLYDGRSFLSSVINGTGAATPTYSSEGLQIVP